MILSKDSTSGTKKNPVTVPGERTKATSFFNDNTKIPAALRTSLMNATVQIDFSNNQGIGSGVILNADPDSNKAYVLTAKHLLYIFNGGKQAGTKPSDIATQAFINKLRIHYAPTALPGVAPSTAAVSAINYTGSSDQTWDYDIMVLEIDDQGFHTHVSDNGFLQDPVLATYTPLLKPKKNTTVCDILDKTKYIYLQMGYGSGRDKDVAATSSYEELKGKLQCRLTEPSAKSPLPSAFEVDQKAGKVSSTNNNVCFLPADITNSTGEGDSGGPLFAIPLMQNLRTNFYLVGTSTGANYLSEQKYKDNPASAPGDDTLFNNVITYWDIFCTAWQW
jgi:hypothetical protein